MPSPTSAPQPLPIPASVIDDILAAQLTVAWAGEGLCVPPRLGWWRTDLVDPNGGGDLFAQLVPRTQAWAALESVLTAARRADAQARARLKGADTVRTLFHLGFHVDELLRERLAFHKRSSAPPHAALPALIDTNAPFSRDALAAHLRAPGKAPTVHMIPGGRELGGAPPVAVELMARHLAASLVPFAEQYPCPFYRAGA